MRSITSLFMGLTILLAAAISHAQVAEKKVLTLDGALKVIAGAVAEAKTKNAPGGVIAVVDDGGNLMALQRLDGTFAAGANIAIGKARTSALFKKPTKVFEDIGPGRQRRKHDARGSELYGPCEPSGCSRCRRDP